MVLFYGLPKQAGRGPSMIEHLTRNRISLNSVDNFRSPLIIINGCFGIRNYWERSNPTRFCDQLPHVFTASSIDVSHIRLMICFGCVFFHHNSSKNPKYCKIPSSAYTDSEFPCNARCRTWKITYPSLSWIITDIGHVLTKKIEVWNIHNRGNELDSKVNKKRQLVKCLPTYIRTIHT